MNQWYLQPMIDHIAVVDDNMKAHPSVLELNTSKGGKSSTLLFQPGLFVRSTKTSLDDVLADPGTTMKAVRNDSSYCCSTLVVQTYH